LKEIVAEAEEMLGLHRSGKRSTSPGAHVRPRSGAKKTLAVFGEERGQSLVEFAVVLPLLLLLLLGIVTFGIAFWNQLSLTQAATAGAQVAAVSRQDVPVDLCTPVNTAIALAAHNLQNANNYGAFPLSFGINVGGTAAQDSTGNTSWRVVFNGGSPGTCPVLLTQKAQVTVTATYGCNLKLLNINFAPNCKLTGQTSEAIQ
jgi:Flp pilus assembly protein TadG